MKKSDNIANDGHVSRNSEGQNSMKSVFFSIREKHMLNLWFTVPIVFICVLIMTLILQEYMPGFSLKSFSYIFGVLNIFIGAIFLMRYNRLGRNQVDFYERITDSAMDYIKSIKKQVYMKRNSLMVNSLAYCFFLSTGLHFLVFNTMNEDLMYGILGLYYGSFAALYCASCFYVLKRFKKEYDEILREVCEE